MRGRVFRQKPTDDRPCGSCAPSHKPNRFFPTTLLQIQPRAEAVVF